MVSIFARGLADLAASVLAGDWLGMGCTTRAKSEEVIMSRYMIQASHDPSPKACLRILDAFLSAGSHYLTNAEWGCMVGEHTAWITVEADDDYQARLMVPPVIRKKAQVVRLNRFTPDQIRSLHSSIDMVA